MKLSQIKDKNGRKLKVTWTKAFILC